VELHVETAGQGPAVLWIHGYTMDSSLWRPLWQLLPGFRHVGVDLPGHGRSGPLRPGLTLPDLAARLARLAQQQQARAVVAISFGSCVALQLALARPRLIDRLAVGAPTIAGAPAAPGTARRNAELALLCRMAGPGAHLTQLWMTSPPDIFRGTEHHPELRARIRGVIDRHQWGELSTGAMRSLVACRQTDHGGGGGGGGTWPGSPPPRWCSPAARTCPRSPPTRSGWPPRSRAAGQSPCQKLATCACLSGRRR